MMAGEFESSSYYEEQARQAEADAKAATLENVRQRSLQAAKTFREMADRTRAIEISRERKAAYASFDNAVPKKRPRRTGAST